MSDPHVSEVLHVNGRVYQGFCTCGWASGVTFYEEADLLRAMHAHEFAVFHIER